MTYTPRLKAALYSVHARRCPPRLAKSPTLDFLLEPELLGRSTVALALAPLARPASTAASSSSCCVSTLAILHGAAFFGVNGWPLATAPSADAPL